MPVSATATATATATSTDRSTLTVTISARIEALIHEKGRVRSLHGLERRR